MKIKYKDKPQEIPVFVNVYRLQCRLARDLCPLEDKDKSTDKDKDKWVGQINGWVKCRPK